MRNRLANVHNRFQGNTKRVLCVCSAGLLRSPTAARVLADKFDLNTRAAGITKEYALIPVDEALLTWADEIVCMDTVQATMLEALCEEYDIQNTPILNMNIPDEFCYMDPILIQFIQETYSSYLGVSNN